MQHRKCSSTTHRFMWLWRSDLNPHSYEQSLHWRVYLPSCFIATWSFKSEKKDLTMTAHHTDIISNIFMNSVISAASTLQWLSPAQQMGRSPKRKCGLSQSLLRITDDYICSAPKSSPEVKSWRQPCDTATFPKRNTHISAIQNLHKMSDHRCPLNNGINRVWGIIATSNLAPHFSAHKIYNNMQGKFEIISHSI